MRKPEGWKTVGESMAEEWEEQIPSPNMDVQDLRVKRFNKAEAGPSRQIPRTEED